MLLERWVGVHRKELLSFHYKPLSISIMCLYYCDKLILKGQEITMYFTVGQKLLNVPQCHSAFLPLKEIPYFYWTFSQ